MFEHRAKCLLGLERFDEAIEVGKQIVAWSQHRSGQDPPGCQQIRASHHKLSWRIIIASPHLKNLDRPDELAIARKRLSELDAAEQRNEDNTSSRCGQSFKATFSLPGIGILDMACLARQFC